VAGSWSALKCKCRYCRIGRQGRPDHPFICLPAGSNSGSAEPQRSPDQPPLSGPVSKCSRANRRAVAVAIDQLGWRTDDEPFTVYINRTRLTTMTLPTPTPRGRGTAVNPDNRFAPTRSEAYDDGWEQDVPPTRATEVRREIAKSVLTRNQSPDVGFDRSVNPYRGCEHGWL